MTTKILLAHLAGRTRPISAGDLAAELHRATDEVAAELRQLHAEGKVGVVAGDPARWYPVGDFEGNR